jgi:hypothetical protein
LHRSEVIYLFPLQRETIVVPHHKVEIVQRVVDEIEAPLRKGVQRNLTGWVENSDFQLTVRLRRQHLFMPLINGRIESTSKGSIVFLRYTLFPATRFLLLFWTIILPAVGFFASRNYGSYTPLAGTMAVLIIFHAVAWANFKLHLKNTRQLMTELLS